MFNKNPLTEFNVISEQSEHGSLFGLDETDCVVRPNPRIHSQ